MQQRRQEFHSGVALSNANKWRSISQYCIANKARSKVTLET